MNNTFMKIENNMADSAGSAVNSEDMNMEVTQVSEGKNMDVVAPVSDWEDDSDDGDDVFDSPRYEEDDEEAAIVAKQMAEIEAAKNAALKKANAAKQKQDAARNKQLARNKKVKAAKPTLILQEYKWLDPLLHGSDSALKGDVIFKTFPIAVQKAMWTLLEKSRQEYNHRINRTMEKINAIGYDGSGEGDETEGGIIKSQERKLIDKLDQIWRTNKTEAQEWSASVRGVSTSSLHAVLTSPRDTNSLMSELVGESPVTPVQRDDSVQSKNAMIAADIMASIGRGYSPRSETSTCVEDAGAGSVACEAYSAHRERIEGFDKLANAANEDPSKRTCTRPCISFKTGKPCPHRAKGRTCNWAHSLEEFKPNRCAFPTSCKFFDKKGGACECAHIVDDEWETPRQVMERLLECGSLIKPLPEKDDEPEITKKSANIGAVEAKMSVDEKRAITQEHREQLARLNSKYMTPVPTESTQRRAVASKAPDVGPAPKDKVWNCHSIDADKPHEKTDTIEKEIDVSSDKTSTNTPSCKSTVIGRACIKCSKNDVQDIIKALITNGISLDNVVFDTVN